MGVVLSPLPISFSSLHNRPFTEQMESGPQGRHVQGWISTPGNALRDTQHGSWFNLLLSRLWTASLPIQVPRGLASKTSNPLPSPGLFPSTIKVLEGDYN